MTFGNMVNQAQEFVPTVAGAPSLTSFSSFNLSGLELMHQLLVPLVLKYTVANAIVPSPVGSSSKIKIFSNLGTIAAISSPCLIALQTLTGTLFQCVSHF